MHEVLTISLSPKANFLSTHFFNSQENYLDYDVSSTKQLNDPSIYLRPSLRANTVNYTPRALLWDYKNGFGSLGQFEYASITGDTEVQDKAEVITTRARIQKNEYQQALDEGKPLPRLTNNDIRYWSDFSRVLYEPNSFNALENWEYDPVSSPNGKLAKGSMDQTREFKNFHVGVEEWDNANGFEFLEENYRRALEETDLLNGVNLVSDLDTAWGGFTSELLNELRDDYNSKSEIFQYSLFKRQKMTTNDLLSRIRGFVALRKNSSLFIPLGVPDKFPNGLNPESQWNTSAMQNTVYESIQILNSQREGRINFANFRSGLTIGANERNVVSDIKVKINDQEYNFSRDFFFTEGKPKKKFSQPHSFSETRIYRATEPIEDKREEKKPSAVNEYHSKLQLSLPDSYPEGILSKGDKFTVEMNIDSSTRSKLLEWKAFVSKALRDSDERSELVDELSTLSQNYEHGWTDSDEEYDDDF